MEEQRYRHEAQIEQFRSVMQMASIALRNAILVNGGAAIALLTFIGNSALTVRVSYLVIGLQIFCIGVAFAAFATAFGYFAQNSHHEKIKNDEESVGGRILGWISAVLVLLSYAAFIAGCFLASLSFS